MAMYLARAGWRVKVFEKRPEPGPATTSRQRSWVLTLYPRGIRPMAAVADVPSLLRERTYKGLVVLPGKPGGKAIVLERCGVLMDRTLLATSLLDAARRQYGSRVEFCFSASLAGVDFVRKNAVFCRTAAATAVGDGRPLVTAAAGARTAGSGAAEGGGHAVPAVTEAEAAGEGVPYNLLVGADGSGSTLRSLLAAAFPGQYDTEVLSSPSSSSGSISCYKAVYGLPPVSEAQRWDPDSGAAPDSRLQGQFFFVLTGGKKGFMSMCRDIDGTYCGYVAASEAYLAGKSREEYLALLPDWGPQLPAEWLPLLADKLVEAPVSTFPTMRSLSRFWGPGGVVLLGDAAHTVTPALGQGLNSALQDCELLAGELQGLGAGGGAGQWDPDTLDAALKRFSETRAPEVRALQELELITGAGLAQLKWAPDQPAYTAKLLFRKWINAQYSGLALLGTVAATIAGAAAGKRAAQHEAAGARDGRAGQEGQQREREAPGLRSAADVLAAQVTGATYVRSPPMYELLRGHMGYREMLVRVYSMAALGTACTAALLGGTVWTALRILAGLAP